MAIRIPQQTVLDYNDSGNVGATSIVSKTFMLPQDTDNIVMLIPTASIVGSAPVVDVFLQTSYNGGTNFQDLASIRLPTLVASSILYTDANTPAMATATTLGHPSVATNVGASTLGANSMSGLPIMGQFGRISIKYTSGTITTNNGVRVQVIANQQAAHS